MGQDISLKRDGLCGLGRGCTGPDLNRMWKERCLLWECPLYIMRGLKEVGGLSGSLPVTGLLSALVHYWDYCIRESG